MKEFNIAVIPGDGIGIDVMHEGTKVLDAFAEAHGGLKFNYRHLPWGCEHYLKTGAMMDENGLETLQEFDSVLLGAVGFPGVPDHISLHGLLLKIRQGFNQYINLRPVRLLPGAPCPLKDKGPEDINFVVVRENVEGEYSNVGGFRFENRPEEIAIQTAVFTRKNTEKVMRYAFELTKKRDQKKKLTCVTKSNALNFSMVFWDKIFREIAPEYPGLETEYTHVDALAMFMVQKPQNYDVMVASNLFGDIITDLGAGLQGGLGFAGSANLNPEREYPSMFEPVHGSAPKYAGKGIANPIAMVWTVKMMLDHLLEGEMPEAVVGAITDVLADKNKVTRDLGGTATTSAVGDALAAAVKKRLS